MHIIPGFQQLSEIKCGSSNFICFLLDCAGPHCRRLRSGPRERGPDEGRLPHGHGTIINYFYSKIQTPPGFISYFFNNSQSALLMKSRRHDVNTATYLLTKSRHATARRVCPSPQNCSSQQYLPTTQRHCHVRCCYR